MPEQFLRALFDGKPDKSFILIWTKFKKRSAFHQTVESAIFDVQRCSHLDTYVGVGLHSRDYGAVHRGTAAEVAGIVGLWADIDFLDDCHKAENLPGSLDEAETIIAGLPSPSVTVQTGHGVQYWWLFREPWVFDSADERAAAIALSQRWHATLQAKADHWGWKVDAVWDIARVLRVPGTKNNNGDPQQDVVLWDLNDARYDPSDFDGYLTDVKLTAVGREVAVGSLTLSERAQPPFDKFDLLTSLEPKFKLSWERKRKDMKDQSPSSYDLSLANYAARYGWTDQEIADLIIAWRVKHGETKDDKHLREDYYVRTITEARSTSTLEVATEGIKEVLYGKVEDRKKAILENLSKLLNVQLHRIVKYLGEQATYRLFTDRGEIELGDVSVLITQQKLRYKLAEVAEVMMPEFGKATWTDIGKLLLEACESQTAGEEATYAGQARDWLNHYLTRCTPNGKLDELKRLPFARDGVTYFFGAEMRAWLALHRQERITTKYMGLALRSYGCAPAHVRAESGKQLEVWRVPDGVEVHDDEAQP